MERSFSRHPPRGTHAPQSIIYGTPRGEHLKGDSADRVGFQYFGSSEQEEKKNQNFMERKTLDLVVLGS